MEILAERIKTRMNDMGFTPRTLGQKLYLSASAVRQWTTENTIPRSDMIPDICKALKCTPNYLFGFSDKVNR